MNWKFWTGELLVSSIISFDTETTFVKDLSKDIPELVLASVSDGYSNFIVKREDLKDFLQLHKDKEFVGHNFAFDFFVVEKYLGKENNIFWERVDNNKVHDTMLLDQLIRLAKGEWSKGGVPPRGLEILSNLYCPIDKRANKSDGGDDPYRLRFGELLGIFSCFWDTEDQGFFEYAIKDAIATWYCYIQLQKEALYIQKPLIPDSDSKFYKMVPDCIQKYGMLTEALQVKASIALRDITIRGIAFNQNSAIQLQDQLEQKVKKDWDYLLLEHPEWFKRCKKNNQLILTKKGNFPSTNDKYLRNILQEIGLAFNIQVPTSDKTNAICTSEKFWGPYIAKPDGLRDTDLHPFLGSWVRVERAKSILKFFDVFRKLEPEQDGVHRVHPSYITLKNTGRTGCTGKTKNRDYDYGNIQQVPKIKGFREIYIATPGYKLLTIDYSAIELRTLATVCRFLFGYSKLGDVIKSGVDPHAYTASMIKGMSLDDFMKLDKATFKKDRQAAKACNFGVPGGLGAKKLVIYAKSNYGVELSEQQAQDFRLKLTKEIYPELEEYLSYSSLQETSRNLKIHPNFLQSILQTIFEDKDTEKILYLIGRTLKGQPFYKNGNEYHINIINKVTEFINNIGTIAKRKDLIELWNHYKKGWKEYNEIVGNQLYRNIFGATAYTLTGRIRAGCEYTDCKNTPFQSLAADGVKLAMWELCKLNYRTVAMIHDELVVEIKDPEEAKIVESVLCKSMEKVLEDYIPVQTEFVIKDTWSKG